MRRAAVRVCPLGVFLYAYISVSYTHLDVYKRQVLYIALRDAYQKLYTYEAEEQTENKQMRESLNVYYDTFFIRFGNLNAKPVSYTHLLEPSAGIGAFVDSVLDNNPKADIYGV